VNDVTSSEEVGLIASASADSTVRLWDLRSKSTSPIASLHRFLRQCFICRSLFSALSRHREAVKSVAIEGWVMASGGKEGNLLLWDYRYQDLVRSFKSHQADLNHIELNSNLIITSSEDRTLKIHHFNKFVL